MKPKKRYKTTVDTFFYDAKKKIYPLRPKSDPWPFRMDTPPQQPRKWQSSFSPVRKDLQHPDTHPRHGVANTTPRLNSGTPSHLYGHANGKVQYRAKKK